MYVMRMTRAALVWKLTFFVVLVAGTFSYLTNPPPGSDAALQATAPEGGTSQAVKPAVAAPGISLVFEVPWGELEVPEVLAVLDAHGVKATFEADPAWVQAYPEAARRIRRGGHKLVSRPYLGDLSIPAMAPSHDGPGLEERARFVAQEALVRAKPGATLRLPADDLSPATARALPIILERLRAQGLVVIPPAK